MQAHLIFKEKNAPNRVLLILLCHSAYSRLGVATANICIFYYMAFALRSHALPATNPLFGGKTGPPVFHIKAGMCLAQGHNKRTCRLVLHNLPEITSVKQGSSEYHFLKSFGIVMCIQISTHTYLRKGIVVSSFKHDSHLNDLSSK